ncbi:MAG: hypothetical protein AAFQ98_14510 [Bacteroidota bacterium]
MRRFLLLVAISIMPLVSSAQNPLEAESTQRGLGYSLGYYAFKGGHPGMQVGVERCLAQQHNFQTIGQVFLQFYSQSKRQTGVGLNARVGQRYTAGFGLIAESYLGIGPELTVHQTEIWDFDTEETTISQTTQLGVLPNLAFGLGYDFNRKLNLPFTSFCRANIAWLIPDRNLVFQTSLNWEVGIVYSPSGNQ